MLPTSSPFGSVGGQFVCWPCVLHRARSLRRSRHNRCSSQTRSYRIGPTRTLLGTPLESSLSEHRGVNKPGAAEFHNLSSNRQRLVQESSNSPAFPNLSGSSASSSSSPRAGRGVRDRLREWRPQKTYVIPQEPIHVTDVPNARSRPESLREGTEPTNVEEETNSLVEALNHASKYSDSTITTYSALRRGDLVELGQNSAIAKLGVFLCMKDDLYIFFTIFGKFHVTRSRRTNFLASQYFGADELDPLVEHINTDENLQQLSVQEYDSMPPGRNISGSVLNKLVKFQNDADAVYRKSSYTSRFDNAHKIVAHPSRRTVQTLEEIASALTGLKISNDQAIPEHTLYAVNCIITRKGFGFQVDSRSYGRSRLVVVESITDVTSVQKVKTWVRAHSAMAATLVRAEIVQPSILKSAGFIKSFVQKARRLLAEGESVHQTTSDGTVLASRGINRASAPEAQGRLSGLRFSESDRTILQVLKLSLAGAFKSDPDTRILPAYILRAVGFYHDIELRESTVHKFLVGVGVLDPFAYPFAIDRDAIIPNADLSDDLAHIQQLVGTGFSLMEAADLEDSMAHFRKDWGEMPVFCIDSSTTTEIDDGISIQAVEGTPDQSWIHIHIAHVSAFAKRSHVLGKLAEYRATSMYLPEGKEPMLPRWISDLFSLGPGKPALTFSVRVNANGEALETQIQPGTIHNVISTTPERVDEALRSNQSDVIRERWTLAVGKSEINGNSQRRAHDGSHFTQSQLSALEKLYTLTMKMQSRRTLPGFPASPYSHKVDITDLPHSPQTYTATIPHNAAFSLKDPSIQISFEKQTTGEMIEAGESLPSQTIVEQCMLLCGAEAARWAATKGLPIVFAGTNPVADNIEDQASVLRDKIEKVDSTNPVATRQMLSKIYRMFAVGVLSSEPVEHKPLGLLAYSRVTSPLRRFFDLLSHWQIDTTLVLEEQKRAAKTNEGGHEHVRHAHGLLDKAAIESIIRFVDHRSSSANAYQSAAWKHWHILAIARAFYLREALLPKPLIARIEFVPEELSLQRQSVGTISQKSRAWLVQLQTTCRLKSLVGAIDTQTCKQGEEWEIEILNVNVYDQEIEVQPLRRLQ